MCRGEQMMHELTGVNYNTGEQNKDMTKATVTGKTLWQFCIITRREIHLALIRVWVISLGSTPTVLSMLAQPSQLAWQYSSHLMEKQLQNILSRRKIKPSPPPQCRQLRLVVMTLRSIHTSYSRDWLLPQKHLGNLNPHSSMSCAATKLLCLSRPCCLQSHKSLPFLTLSGS